MMQQARGRTVSAREPRRMAGLVPTLAATLALAIGLTGPAMADLVADTPHMVVTGTGEVQAVPDMATVNLGVQLQARTAEEVAREAADRMREVFAVLDRAGVAREDVQTSGLSLNPVYEQSRDDVSRPPRLLGFEAENTVRVTVRDLGGLGEILDAVIDEGANSFRGLQFGLQDPAIAQEDARREAVADALARAGLMAEAAGARRGPILTMREGGAEMPRPEYARMAAADSGMPVAPGAITVRAQVTMVFELLQ